MVITLDDKLAAALSDRAERQGMAAEALALNSLREKVLAPSEPLQPRDEWERHVLGLAKDCGVSLSDAALSREAMYE